MTTSYARHAWYRVSERLSLSTTDVADILDWDLAVDIGIESGTNRVHRLFFSPSDEMCFVAIQDIKTKTVITVLPIDFHENIAWSVSIAAQNQAMALICPAGREQSTVVDQVERVAPSPTFRIMAYAYIGSNMLKVFNLGSWPSAPYQARVEKLLGDDDFFYALEERLASKLDQGARVSSIYVRLGGKGKPTFISRHTPCMSY